MERKKNLTSFILFALDKAVPGYLCFEDFTNHHYRYKYGMPDLNKASLAQALKRLRKRGLIDFATNDKLAYRLTDQGQQEAVWESILNNDEEWDGKWRLVSFDIPEQRRQARNLLRTSLKKWGFTSWQQSLWATKKNCIKPLREFVKKAGIKDWVIIVESNNVG